ITAIVEGHRDTDPWVAGQDAAIESFADALIDRLDELLGNRATLDVVDELVAFARLARPQANLAMPVVARTTGLTNVLAFGFRFLADGLAESDLGLADIGLD